MRELRVSGAFDGGGANRFASFREKAVREDPRKR
jgi:hypothetical protein